MLDLSLLNAPQRQAVECVDGPLLVLAGAGSGKTRVLTYRIANLIENHGVQPWQILALTFTNKAAAEMRDRTERLTGLPAKDMWVMTFHSFCSRVLRYDIDKLGYSSQFTIYDDNDQNTVITDIIKKLGIDDKQLPKGYIRSVISDAKNTAESPEQYIAEVGDSGGKLLTIYREYQKRLAAANALDFDDLLIKTVELFKSCPDVLDKYRRRFKYVLVDEYQDTNAIQYRIVRLLCEESRNICVVGDDDQSIYGWRGADIRNILDFEKDFAGATVVRLEQNYRSTKAILDKANKVIAHNKGRKPKTLWTDKESREQVELITVDSEREEAYTIGSLISAAHKRGRSYNDFAVLYRTHAQSRTIEAVLQQSFRIPISLIGGTRFYEYKEVKDLLSYLRLIANTTDDVAFKRVINVPKRGIGDTTVRELTMFAEQHDVSLLNAATMPELNPRIQAKLSSFILLMTDFFVARKQMALDELAMYVIEKTRYAEYLAEQQDGLLETRVQNIEELLGAMREHMQEIEGTDVDPLNSFLENAALLSSSDGISEDDGTVKLMTMHCAKGLEFPVVFMPGMEENIFPSSKSRDTETRMEEERRLCYVGITRAEQKLYLLNCRSRMLYGDRMFNMPSRFLDEMGLIADEDSGASAYEARYSGGSSRYSSVKPYAGRSGTSGYNKSGGSGTGASSAKNNFGSGTSAVKSGFKSTAPSPAATAAPGRIIAGSDYKKLQRVVHQTFGRGVVTDVSGTGNSAIITVDFEKFGVKRLAAAYTPMKCEDDND